jgi:hypothetical protein
MDVYMLARMLYYIEKNSSKTIACFAGTNHASAYQMFFDKYLNNKIATLTWVCDKSYGLSKSEEKQKRCVTINLESTQILFEKDL